MTSTEVYFELGKLPFLLDKRGLEWLSRLPSDLATLTTMPFASEKDGANYNRLIKPATVREGRVARINGYSVHDSFVSHGVATVLREPCHYSLEDLDRMKGERK